MSNKKRQKTNKAEEKLEHSRHTLAHILAAAVTDLYPKTKLGMGPATENGFYYDFMFSSPLSSAELKKIEKRMKEIIKEGLPLRQRRWSKQKAASYFKDQPFKKELIKELPGKTVGVNEMGDFADLCKGGHVENTADLNPEAFTLSHLAGAYWKGDEKNPQLTRIYGYAFLTSEKLLAHLKMIEEAEKRDHRKLGKQLDLFHFSELVGPGLPLFTPKGTHLKETLQREVEEICRGYGFEKVITPHLAKEELYEISGHAQKFSEELFHVSSKYGHEFVIKPVQCPHQTQIYASQTRSYKDLPIRYMESEKQYRAEKPGEIGGLNRVYAITVEDGHSFCTLEQVKQEIKNMINVISEFYKRLGLWGNHSVYLSVRDYKHPEKYIGTKKDWSECEKILEEVVKEMKLKAKKQEGEAAHYGPKIDFMFKDALGKEIQIPTVQIDFATPKRFNLSYVAPDGSSKTPVMVHRAILGSYERFLALLIEHYAGAFPFWLAPVQARIITVSAGQNKYGNEVNKNLKESGFRVELDDRNESVGKKIHEAETQKIPVIAIAGDKEKKDKTLSLRFHGGKDGGTKSLQEVTRFLKKAEADRKNELT